MKQMITSVIILTALVISTGCSTNEQCLEPQTVTVIKTIYVQKDIPETPKEPEPSQYEFFTLEIDGKQYYAIDKVNAAVMVGNYVGHKGWSGSLVETLNSLKDQNNTK